MADGAWINGVWYEVTGVKDPACRCTCGDCWSRTAQRPDPRSLCDECQRREPCDCLTANKTALTVASHRKDPDA